MSYDLSTLLKASNESLTQIVDLLSDVPSLSLSSLNQKKTALIIVDMVNGFVKDGVMSSPRIQTIIPSISSLMVQAKQAQMPMVAFADCHEESSIEFASYPPHCLIHTEECEIIDELKVIGGYELILKASTNGFLEPAFHEWLKKNEEIEQFIIVGDCTDICVEQFAITLKTYFTSLNRPSRLIVPINGVQTYDLGIHAGDFMNLMALYKMHANGIEIVKEITN